MDPGVNGSHGALAVSHVDLDQKIAQTLVLDHILVARTAKAHHQGTLPTVVLEIVQLVKKHSLTYCKNIFYLQVYAYTINKCVS